MKTVDGLDYVFEFPENELSGKFFVDIEKVNIDDLIISHPGGSLIRTTRDDAIKYIPPQSFDPSFIAGWISDAA